MYLRVFMFLLLLVSLLFFPWWLSLFIAVMYLLVFKAYEVIVLGFVADSLFAVPTVSFFGLLYVYTSLFTIFFITTAILKKHIVYY